MTQAAKHPKQEKMLLLAPSPPPASKSTPASRTMLYDIIIGREDSGSSKGSMLQKWAALPLFAKRKPASFVQVSVLSGDKKPRKREAAFRHRTIGILLKGRKQDANKETSDCVYGGVGGVGGIMGRSLHHSGLDRSYYQKRSLKSLTVILPFVIINFFGHSIGLCC